MQYTILYNKLNKFFTGKLRRKNTGFLYQYHPSNTAKLMYLKIVLNMKRQMISKQVIVFTFEPVPYKIGQRELKPYIDYDPI